MQTTACIRTSPPAIYDQYGLESYGELGAALKRVSTRPSEAIRKREGFLLYGPTGSYKSSIAAAFHQELVDRKLMARWVECAQIPNDPIEAEDVLEPLMDENAYVVIFDDLGKEAEHNHKRVAKVLQTRALMTRRFDIFTTNLNIDPDAAESCELAQVYGEHIRSRVWGMCRRNIVEVNNADARTTV